MNNLSLDRIRRAFPLFNEVSITEEQIWRFAKREKLIIKEMPLVDGLKGYYKRIGSKHFILIDERLDPLSKLVTMLHEVCHYLFDEPNDGDNYAFYRGNEKGREDRRELRADAFALIALLPFHELRRVRSEDLENNPVFAHIFRKRMTIYLDYGV